MFFTIFCLLAALCLFIGGSLLAYRMHDWLTFSLSVVVVVIICMGLFEVMTNTLAIAVTHPVM